MKTTNNTNTPINAKFGVLEAAACMPFSCWGKYKRVGVVEVDDHSGPNPKMLSERALNCKRVIQTWEKLHVGKTDRDAFTQGYNAARELAAVLNDEWLTSHAA